MAQLFFLMARNTKHLSPCDYFVLLVHDTQCALSAKNCSICQVRRGSLLGPGRSGSRSPFSRGGGGAAIAPVKLHCHIFMFESFKGKGDNKLSICDLANLIAIQILTL